MAKRLIVREFEGYDRAGEPVRIRLVATHGSTMSQACARRVAKKLKLLVLREISRTPLTPVRCQKRAG